MKHSGPFRVSLLFLIVWPAISGCSSEPLQPDVVARIGERTLTVEEVARAIRTIGPVLDSTEAARRYVDQWITDELLAREADRRGLRNDPALRQLVEESERSVVVSALIEDIFTESVPEVSQADIRTYFKSHKEQLRLLEPYVRVRYISVASADTARMILRRLVELDSTRAEDWSRLARQFAPDPEVVIGRSEVYEPESRVFGDLPLAHEALLTLRPGRTTHSISENGRWHVFQLVARVEAGSIPRVDWIEDTLRQRMEIEARKQLYTHLVQDLRNEALARQVLEIR